jgi:HlyD family secretion protein
MELGNVRQMQAVAEVFEADIPILRVGMESEIKVDASGELLRGWIADIGHIVARKAVLTNDPVSDTDARVVEVRIQLDADTTERVARLSNARVEVRIHLERSELIPDRKSSGTELTNGSIRNRSQKSASHVN